MPAFLSRILQSHYAKLREWRGFIWNTRAIKARNRNMYLAEQMEVRHLLSADGAPLAMDDLLRSQLSEQEVFEQLIETGLINEAANEGTQIELIRKRGESPRDNATSEFSDTNVNLENSTLSAEYASSNIDNNEINRLQELDGHQFVVIDPAVDDINILLESFIGLDAIEQLDWQNKEVADFSVQIAEIATVDGQSPVTLVILNAEQDGIEQISAVLAEQYDITALHILSHGDQGKAQLGNTDLNSENIELYYEQLSAWGNALNADGDILLYGCNIAAGELGINFIDRLAGITQADIAASNNLTGNSFIGGDWIFEVETGYVELSAADFFASNDPRYQGVLDDDETKVNLKAHQTTTGITFEVSLITQDSVSLKVEGSKDLSTNTSYKGIKEIWGTSNNDNNTLVVESVKPLSYEISKTDIKVYDNNLLVLTAYNIQNLKGGDSSDIFKFVDGAKLEGTLDGGDGTNTIDLRTYTGIVQVNLEENKASREENPLAKSVENIQNIFGGTGKSSGWFKKDTPNTLIGDENVNNISGGAGIDLITGGAGQDVLAGGKGNDTYVFSLDDFETNGNIDLDNHLDTITESPNTKDSKNNGLDTLDFSAFPIDGDDQFELNFWLNVAEPSTNENSPGIQVSLNALGLEVGVLFQERVKNVEKVTVGKGHNTFHFGDDWAELDQNPINRNKLLVETFQIGSKDDTYKPKKLILDFSSVTNDLIFEIDKEGLVTVTEYKRGETDKKLSTLKAYSVHDLMGGQGNNTYKFLEGGKIFGTLAAGALNQDGTSIEGQQNILDYSKFKGNVGVNFTNDAFEFSTDVTLTGPIVTNSAGQEISEEAQKPKQERWIYTFNVIEGEYSLTSSPTDKSSGTDKTWFEIGGDESSAEQGLKKLLEQQFERNDFSVTLTNVKDGNEKVIGKSFEVKWTNPIGVETPHLFSVVRHDTEREKYFGKYKIVGGSYDHTAEIK
jgi:hypothetical protein